MLARDDDDTVKVTGRVVKWNIILQDGSWSF